MQNTIEQLADDMHGRLVSRRVDQLVPHPCYLRHQFTASLEQMSALIELGESGFREPLVITQDGIIIDGYARWELAQKRDLPNVLCLEYELTKDEALEALIRRHRDSKGINHFCRIVLAQELEPWLKRKAHLNQRRGGQYKGSSSLTEAEKLDVRKEIACIAGVSVGNVTKVKQLSTTAHPDLVRALRQKEISIHRAWLWSKLPPEEQQEELLRYQGTKGVRGTIRKLVSKYRSTTSRAEQDEVNLNDFCGAIHSDNLGQVAVVAVKVPGRAVFVTEELLRTLKIKKEFALTCVTSNL